ncbi:hypothetical protein [Dickeya dianthicola]|nr:3-ketoacyl-CoA thiolase, Acetyl-Co acetyltransferase [Dickeya dianthicola RNS04.9]MBT1428900.1 hypothetical protein [Dickeya dianthicola]MBT1432930.1 hypothetical protein [Dickeya dianthicola]MBT1460401.1 hypothetical protein [Dickeya dianthicola]MBT1489598.1 hypothetical protein [Dickeya dianthicola]
MRERERKKVVPLVTRRGDRIAIVSGLRTPFARQATVYHGITAGGARRSGVFHRAAHGNPDAA